MERGGYIYIMTNKSKSTLYVGVTSNIRNRVAEHKEKRHSESFTAKYNINILVYYERFEYIEEAITREKQLKSGSRKTKENLINKMNPEWLDLLESIEE